MNKTLEKVEAICKPYDIEVEVRGSAEVGWDVWCFAPPKMVFSEANSTAIHWEDETIRGIISWIKYEISDGLRKLDPKNECDYDILSHSGQLEDAD